MKREQPQAQVLLYANEVDQQISSNEMSVEVPECRTILQFLPFCCLGSLNAGKA